MINFKRCQIIFFDFHLKKIIYIIFLKINKFNEFLYIQEINIFAFLNIKIN